MNVGPMVSNGSTAPDLGAPRKKILVLVRSLSAGGAERQAILNAQRLSQKGFSVDLACFYGSDTGYQNTFGSNVRLLVLSKNSRSIWQVFIALSNLISDEGYSIVYSFTGTPNVLAALCKLRNRSLKVLWGKRATRLNLSDYSLKYSVEVWAEKLLKFAPDIIISNSQASADQMIEGGFAAKKIEVVYNGIDTQTFIPNMGRRDSLRQSWFNDPEGLFIIGCVARLDPMKDHKSLVHAFQRAHEICKNLRLVIVGGDRRGLKRDLQELTYQLNVDAHIVWIEHFDAIEKVYPSFDLVTLSSSYGEGFPNVLAEAMACGVPCVSTDVGDASTILGEYGLTVPPNESGQLAEAWLQLKDADRATPQELWNHIDSLFSSSVLSERMFNLCQKMLGSSIERNRWGD